MVVVAGIAMLAVPLLAAPRVPSVGEWAGIRAMKFLKTACKSEYLLCHSVDITGTIGRGAMFAKATALRIYVQPVPDSTTCIHFSHYSLLLLCAPSNSARLVVESERHADRV
eukprot:2923732-Rhodomonas_salina.1